MSLILDIETYTLDDAKNFIEEPSAPANYKDPLKIAAFIEEAKARELSRCALNLDLCRIVAIGFASDAGEGVYVMQDEAEEASRLIEMWEIIARTPQIIGFNLLSFDLPVMIRRSQYLGIASVGLNLDKYRTAHLDLMEFLSFRDKEKRRSLDFYCKRFGIAIPDTTTGKDIDALVKAGEWGAVEAHCRADVQKTAALARRVGVLAPAREAAGVL